MRLWTHLSLVSEVSLGTLRVSWFCLVLWVWTQIPKAGAASIITTMPSRTQSPEFGRKVRHATGNMVSYTLKFDDAFLGVSRVENGWGRENPITLEGTSLAHIFVSVTWSHLPGHINVGFCLCTNCPRYAPLCENISGIIFSIWNTNNSNSCDI